MRAYPALVPICCITAAGFLTSCQDASQSPPIRPEVPAEQDPPGSMLGSVDLIYVCGNKFLATNATSPAVQVSYRVVGTSETGGLTLREGPGGDPGHSETELQTENPGAVELYQGKSFRLK